MEATTMTRKEELESAYWDFYKEVHNFRPRHIRFDNCTEADLEQMLKELGEHAKVVFAQQEADEQASIVLFEKRVATVIECGAANRETALRWIMDASDHRGDWEGMCYENGLPWRYFSKAA